MPDWRQCEGELIDGEFPLERYLGGGETRGVFLTSFGGDKAAIRLETADPVKAADLVKRWKRSAALRHRHLAAVHAYGSCVVAGEPVAYLVTEFADENLAEVLDERPLTAVETREMLLPVADALAYLHGQGLVHGNLKPSNVLGVGDAVKITSDTVSPGDPSGDIRALGVMLGQVCRHRSPGLPQSTGAPAVDASLVPYWELAENCLHQDPRLRWQAAKIADWLRSPGETSGPAANASSSATAGTFKRRHYVAAGAVLAVVAAVAAFLVMNRTAGPVPIAGEPVHPAPAESQAPPAPAPTPVVPPAAPKASAQADRSARPPSPRPAAQDGVIRRVLPDIPAKARETITGRPVVVVRVTVDPAGKVTDAALERSFSPYFARLTLDAARRWQFEPQEGAGPRNWTLRFEFTQTDTKAIPRMAGRG
jgi:TonB family protein